METLSTIVSSNSQASVDGAHRYKKCLAGKTDQYGVFVIDNYIRNNPKKHASQW